MKKRSGNLQTKKRASKVLGIVIAVITVLIIAAFAAIIIMALKDNPATVSDDTAPINSSSSDKADTPSNNAQEPEDPEEKFEHADEIKTVRVEDEPEIEFANPLTGEAVSEAIASQRPAAIMINNIRVSCPQVGVSNADIIYECMAEGGITRLLMLAQDYASLGEVGSIRSSRKYFIDFALNHDAIYVHAGGSDEAYSEIVNRSIDHIDGVRADGRTGTYLCDSCFYRNQQRRNTMGLEHSMMSTGDRILYGIDTMGYRTELKSYFNNPMNIIKQGYKVELEGDVATHLSMSYTPGYITEYRYDEASGDYLRWQYGTEHIDGETGEQLAFTNVLVLVMDHVSTGDALKHINVSTTGQGRGYYLTGGKMVEVNWSRSSENEPMTLTDSEGYPLLLNKGKTFINVISNEVEQTLVIDAE